MRASLVNCDLDFKLVVTGTMGSGLQGEINVK